MNPCRNGFAIICSAFLLAGCQAPEPITRLIVPDLPKILRTPVEVQDRKAETLADVGLILTDHVQALDTANGKIKTTDCIWTAAEQGEEPDCEELGNNAPSPAAGVSAAIN